MVLLSLPRVRLNTSRQSQDVQWPADIKTWRAQFDCDDAVKLDPTYAFDLLAEISPDGVTWRHWVSAKFVGNPSFVNYPEWPNLKFEVTGTAPPSGWKLRARLTAVSGRADLGILVEGF